MKETITCLSYDGTLRQVNENHMSAEDKVDQLRHEVRLKFDQLSTNIYTSSEKSTADRKSKIVRKHESNENKINRDLVRKTPQNQTERETPFISCQSIFIGSLDANPDSFPYNQQFQTIDEILNEEREKNEK